MNLKHWQGHLSFRQYLPLKSPNFGIKIKLSESYFCLFVSLSYVPRQGHNTDCIGTLRLNRKTVPQEVKSRKLKKGETVCQHSGPATVLKWCEKKFVSMFYIYHSDDKKTDTVRGNELQKPVTVICYNKNTGGIYMKDQML
jgi:hypothetical protein